MNYSFGILLGFISLTNGARILAVHGTDLNSHFRVFSAVVEQLAQLHNITFYLDAVLEYEAPPNVILRTFQAPIKTPNLNMTELIQNPCEIDSYDIFYNHILTLNETYFETALKSSYTTNLIHSNESYDLFLVSGYGTEHFYQLAHVLDVPLVQVTPSLLFPWNNAAIRNPYSWINDFSFMVSETNDTILGKLIKFVKNALINYCYYWEHLSVINGVTRKFFPPNTPSIQEVNKNTDLIFVNTHNVMGYTKPNIPTLVEIGGLHIKEPKALPSNLEDFISEAGEHGFIYFSLGSVIQESAMSDQIRQSILRVFSKLPQRVVWKWKGEMPNAPSNVKVFKWLPQTDILAHRNIKLFITQGGMLSTQEAIYHGVPVLIMPVLFDQYNNAFLADKKGFGKSITLCHFTEKLFEIYLKELMHNSSYSQISKQMSRTMKHQNKNLREKVNWWVDFVISHKGTKILQPAIHSDSWIDLSFDLFSFFTFIFTCVMYLYILYLFLYIVRIIFVKKCDQKYKTESFIRL